MVRRFNPPPVQVAAPTVKNPRAVTVSPAAMKAVLVRLDDYIGSKVECWPSNATLAQETNLSERTVVRTLKALSLLSVIIIDRRPRYGIRLNHIRIVWTEIALLCRSDEEEEPSPYPSPIRGEGKELSDTVSDLSDTVSEQSDTVSPNPPMETADDPPKKDIDPKFLVLKEETQQILARIVRVVRPRPSDDVTFLAMVARLRACGEISEHDLADSLAAFEHVSTAIGNRVAYLRTCLREKFARDGTSFEAKLRSGFKSGVKSCNTS